MKEVGCNPFVIKRWDKGGKTGFNFLSPTDLPAQEQNCEPSISSAQIEKGVQDNKDEFSDKVSRGAAWNNAFAYCLKLEGVDFALKNVDKFCILVVEAAEEIAPHQKAFVSNIKEREDCPKEAIEHVEKPKDSDYIQEEVKVDDLPF